jgi:hypothetical protein
VFFCAVWQATVAARIAANPMSQIAREELEKNLIFSETYTATAGR